MDKPQMHIFYSGRVQGVGFRYTFQSWAQKFNCSGWVKNLADGRVEAVIQGNEDDLKALLKGVDETFDQHIRDKQVLPMSITERFNQFTVRF